MLPRMPSLRPDPLRLSHLVLAAILLSLSAPTWAAERGYAVTDFERIDVTGPYTVIVETGRGPSARATGSVEALERLSVEMQGRILRIKPSQNAWGGWPGTQAKTPTIKVTVPLLREAALSGSGSLTISKLFATVLGSGIVTLAGKAATGLLSSEGTGNIVATSLTVQALEVKSSSAGTVQVTGGRTAKISSTGAGEVSVAGDPACSVQSSGAGQVTCGK
jgi:Putative auto-transporter adhesin, head GIN domain